MAVATAQVLVAPPKIHHPMRYFFYSFIQWFCFLNTIGVLSCQAQHSALDCPKKRFFILESELIYPITIGEAFKLYNLSFKGNGIFIKIDSTNGSEIFRPLHKKYLNNMDLDENEKPEDYFKQQVTGYSFDVLDSKSNFDTLFKKIEKQNGIKFNLMDSKIFNDPKSLWISSKMGSPTNVYRMRIDPCMVIVIYQSGSKNKNKYTQLYVYLHKTDEQIYDLYNKL